MQDKSFYENTGLGLIEHDGQTYYLTEQEYEALAEMGPNVAAGEITDEEAVSMILSARSQVISGSATNKHTPGPWRIEGHKGELGASNAIYAGRKSKTEPSRRVALCYTQRKPGRVSDAITDEDRANAQLIATAPDLLEVCESALDYINRLAEHGSAEFGGEAALAEQLHTAITKATGGQQ